MTPLAAQQVLVEAGRSLLKAAWPGEGQTEALWA